MLTFIPLYARSLGLAEETSLFYACYAGAIVVTRPFVGRIFDRKCADYVVYPGLLLFAIGLFCLGHASDILSLLGAAVLLGMGFGAATPAFQTLAVRSAPPARAGVAPATYFWSLDISVGLAAAGLGIVAVNCGFPFTYAVLDFAAAPGSPRVLAAAAIAARRASSASSACSAPSSAAAPISRLRMTSAAPAAARARAFFS